MYRYLARELRRGTHLIEAVAGLFVIYSDDGRKVRHPIAVATRLWLPLLRERRPLVEVLRQWIPADEMPLVAALERSRDAGQLLERLEAAARFRSAMGAQISKVTFYPIVLVGLLGLIMPVFYERVYLEVANTFGEKPVGWQAVGLELIAFVAAHGGLLSLCVVCLVAGVSASMPTLTGPLRTVLDHVFPWSMYRVQSGTAFLDAFGLLLLAGMQPLEAVSELERSGSPYLKWRLGLIRLHLRRGVAVGSAFVLAGRWPSMAITYSLRACRPNDVAVVIGTSVKDWRDSLLRRTERTGEILYALFFVIIGLLLIVVFASTFGFTYSAVERLRSY